MKNYRAKDKICIFGKHWFLLINGIRELISIQASPEVHTLRDGVLNLYMAHIEG